MTAPTKQYGGGTGDIRGHIIIFIPVEYLSDTALGNKTLLEGIVDESPVHPERGVLLHQTLTASETRRRALRFYHPKGEPFGVDFGNLARECALAGERVRWYIRRYMAAVLFDSSRYLLFSCPCMECPLQERRETHGSMGVAKVYMIRGEKVASIEVMDPGAVISDYTGRYEPPPS